MGLCPPRVCGCSFTSSTLQITGDGTPYNIESYDGVATESPNTLPSAGVRFEGMRIWLEDTKRLVIWDDAAALWLVLAEPWQQYTPTLANITQGTGSTLEMITRRRHKTLECHGRLILGTGGALTGDPLWSVPYAHAQVGALTLAAMGHAYFLDSAVPNRVFGAAFINHSTSNVFFRHAGGALSATAPFTWASPDQIQFHLHYPIEGGL